MIDPQMQRYFQRIYGAQASPEFFEARRSLFVNRLTQDSTKSPSVIFQESFRRTSMGGSTERLSSLPESHRSSALSRKIDDFLNSVVENNNNNHSERRKKEDIRGSTRSLSNSSRRRTMDYPLPDLSKVKSTLLTSKHYQQKSVNNKEVVDKSDAGSGRRGAIGSQTILK
ncbi:Uncharacterized protein FKW44_000369 [Caligus rogercresseyi]|uniref:Uncharacterized protein n=1 Tax=Caligus rogercresseyi TaxID=217165 RepID=A0A7T8KHI5_CALRO|nr:Uncharacterized protein FKW44_000369 [Caligus rogercresseyi]